jgi:hypothetical protein
MPARCCASGIWRRRHWGTSILDRSHATRGPNLSATSAVSGVAPRDSASETVSGQLLASLDRCVCGAARQDRPGFCLPVLHGCREASLRGPRDEPRPKTNTRNLPALVKGTRAGSFRKSVAIQSVRFRSGSASVGASSFPHGLGHQTEMIEVVSSKSSVCQSGVELVRPSVWTKPPRVRKYKSREPEPVPFGP